MKKITITNAYTWYNKGDAGILLGIVEYLKKYYDNNLSIDILSFTPDEDRVRYCKDKIINNVYSNVLNPHPYNHTKMGKIFAIIKLFFNMVYQLFMSKFFMKKLVEKYDNYKSLNNADYIIVCGGGFLGGRKLDSLMHLFQIYINTLFGKKVILMGTSIEPITNKLVKRITEKVLKKTDFVFARETITYDYLKKFLNKDKFKLIPDMAFMLPNEKNITTYLNKSKKYDLYIGITVRNWNFPNEKNSNKIMENYKQSLANFMDKYIEEKKCAFVFIPQVIVDYGNDVVVAKEIKSLLKEKNQDSFIIIEDDITPAEIKTLIYNLDMFVGTRMHSNIFATSMSIPTLAIAYERKTNGIMHMLKLDDYVLEMNKLTLDDLIEKMKNIENNYDEIKKLLDIEIISIKKEIIEKLDGVLKGFEL